MAAASRAMVALFNLFCLSLKDNAKQMTFILSRVYPPNNGSIMEKQQQSEGKKGESGRF